MNITRSLAATAFGLILIAAPSAGDTQSFQSGQPIMWGADTVEYQGSSVTLIGRAEVTQGEARMRADRISGIDQSGSIDRIEATGNVYFVTPEQTIRGDRAVYTPGNDTIVLTGDVILTQGENVITGASLTYNTRTESARMDGGSNGRVQGVFYPERSGD